jgi:uncharacterized protein YidB (DUF937 family)
MAGLDDLLKGVQSGGGGGLGDILGGVLGGGAGGGGLGGVLGGILKGGGGGGGAGGGAAGGVLKMLLPMVVGMLASGGLGKILGGMRTNGLSAQADSWVGTGENEPVGAEDVRRVVDPAELEQIAQQLGVSEDAAAAALAEVLPHAVDHVTPDGHVPDDDRVDASLDQLKGLFG